jgi:hypothetical protein
MNRRWQLERTLEDNLRALEGTSHFIALCDYHSADGLARLVQRFPQALHTGTILYFRTTEPSSFHASLAKNTAHRLALSRRPDVLFNLDADNRISRETVALVENVFRRQRDTALHNWSGEWGEGTCGRIALAAQRWQELGGYDEALLPMGWQDLDLLYRARLLGLRYQPCSRGAGLAVANSYEDKLANVNLPAGVAAPRAREAYQNTFARNLMTALGRSPRLRFEDQRRFRGQMNFAAEVTI